MACHDGVTREGLAHRARPERMRTRAHATQREETALSENRVLAAAHAAWPVAALPSRLSSPLGASLRHTRTPGPLHRPCPLPGMCLPECPSLYANVTFSERLI